MKSLKTMNPEDGPQLQYINNMHKMLALHRQPLLRKKMLFAYI